MKLTCSNDDDHKRFLRVVYAKNGYRENVEEVDEQGKDLGAEPSVYLDGQKFEYECAECGSEAVDSDSTENTR